MLGLLERFRKKEDQKVIHSSRALSELEQLCGDDKQTYEALHHTMFLDPRKIGASMKDAGENAKKFAKEKNFYRARVWYDIAGGLAIYDGDVKKVVEFFSESQKISGVKYPILDDADKAVAKAQEYYKKYLKS
jgi:hypothetical protein